MDTAKNAARKLLDSLPEQATWDDIMYEFYVKQKIEAGLLDLQEGRVVSQAEVKQRLQARAPLRHEG